MFGVNIGERSDKQIMKEGLEQILHFIASMVYCKNLTQKGQAFVFTGEILKIDNSAGYIIIYN